MNDKKIALVYEVFDIDITTINNYINKFIKKGIFLEKVFLFSQKVIDINLISFSNVEMMKSSKFKKAKFETFKLLDIYDIVIYSGINNIDNFFVDNISQFYDYSLCVFKEDTVSFVEKYLKKSLKKYSLFTKSVCFDFFIITRKIVNYSVVYCWLNYASIVYSNYFNNRIDGVLNIMLQKFDFSIYYMQSKSSKCFKEKDLLVNQLTRPLVSVLMSIYNRNNYLDNAVNSILNQTYKNFEFIIVVDFSVNQKVIINKLKKYNDKRIKIISTDERLGFAKSLNIGLKVAKGKYLARMDDDDISDVNRFQKQVSFLEQNEHIDVLGSNMRLFGISNEVWKTPYDSEILKVKCLYKVPVFHPTIMVRLASMKKFDLFYRDVYAEDYDLWGRAVKYLNFATYPEVLYYYHLSDNNRSLNSEKKLDDSHNNIMIYQLKNYLNLNLTFDELHLLSGRIDVLGNCKNLDLVYRKKLYLWYKIRKANKTRMFYKDSAILAEIEEIKEYYSILKKRDGS